MDRTGDSPEQSAEMAGAGPKTLFRAGSSLYI